MILDHIENVDTADSSGVTPLHIACQNRNVNIVKLLLDHAANVNKKDENNISPLYK